MLRRAQGQDEVKNPALNCEVPQPSAHFKLKFTQDVFKKTVPQEMVYAKPKFILAEEQKKLTLKLSLKETLYAFSQAVCT